MLKNIKIHQETMRKIFILVLVLFLVTAVVVILFRADDTKFPTDRILVVTSFYPLAEFAKEVGGAQVEVINLTRAGVEPHDYEPTPRDIATAYSADIFILNGSGFDPWAEKIQIDLTIKGVFVLKMSENFSLLPAEFEDEQTDEEDSESSDVPQDENSQKFDPHIWLDPIFAQQEVVIIRDAFKKIDPGKSQMYETNAEQYVKKLSELDTQYAQGLATCSIRDIITSHAAFNYLAKRYNIKVIPIAGITPDAEPSPKKIAEISELVKAKHIQYIFFETLVSPKLAETIALEVGAQTLVFNPIEGLTEAELAAGKNYLTVMKENLKHLRQALVC